MSDRTCKARTEKEACGVTIFHTYLEGSPARCLGVPCSTSSPLWIGNTLNDDRRIEAPLGHPVWPHIDCQAHRARARWAESGPSPSASEGGRRAHFSRFLLPGRESQSVLTPTPDPVQNRVMHWTLLCAP